MEDQFQKVPPIGMAYGESNGHVPDDVT